MMERSTSTATARPEIDTPPADDDDRPAAHLSRERIIRVAITLLDSEGLAGLSMRRLADRLDAGAMSLYWYFSTKDELLAAATETVLGEVRLQDLAADDWREAIRSIAFDIRTAIRRHPWLRQMLSSRPAAGPNGLAVFEAILLSLAKTGLEGHRLDVAATTLIGYVLGFAVGEDVWVDAFQAEGQEGLTFPPGLMAEQPVLDPYFAAATRRDPDQRFAAGINLILAGIEAGSTGDATDPSGRGPA
jgi:AcrR family transcriptional regulator